MFAGNTDRNTVIIHILNPHIEARFIRFHPLTHNFNVPCLRTELYGCRSGRYLVLLHILVCFHLSFLLFYWFLISINCITCCNITREKSCKSLNRLFLISDLNTFFVDSFTGILSIELPADEQRKLHVHILISFKFDILSSEELPNASGGGRR